ncbi:MAG TPA: phosphoribosylglycinamide synthetase C domain-containing protein, partial [Candidatus Polarisedimenticolia bacterium]|nr:phosphoribosylglycinamide synthetase C domain-containing protein [Candidatus Polarisedimenticolia bacterium]
GGDDVVVFHAATRAREGRIETAGGRVLTVTARAEDLAEARRRAYAAVAGIRFPGMQHRRDIAAFATAGTGRAPGN